MSKLIHCEECREPIEWDDDIIRTECGSIYHEGCCTVFPIRYGVMVGDDYKGNSDDRPSIACALLSHGEYIDIKECEAE